MTATDRPSTRPSTRLSTVLPLVRWIHSVASDSALRELGKHGTPETEVLVEVNIAGEPDKSELWKRLTHVDPDERMPPADGPKQLTAAEKEGHPQVVGSNLFAVVAIIVVMVIICMPSRKA